MKKTRGILMTRFFALLIAVVLLLGSIPATATDYQDDAETPAATSVDENADPSAADETVDDNGDGTEDPAPAGDEEATVADEGEDATVDDGEDATVAEGEDATVAEGEDATVAGDEDATEAEPVVKATPTRSKAKLAATGAKRNGSNAVPNIDNSTYSVIYATRSSATKDGKNYFSGLTKITYTMKDSDSPDRVRMVVCALDEDPPNTFLNPDSAGDDFPHPYVTREESGTKVTLTFDAQRYIDEKIEKTDGTEGFVVYYTRDTIKNGVLSNKKLTCYVDEEGPAISIGDFEDKWYSVYDPAVIDIKAEDIAGLDDDPVEADEGDVTEYSGEGDYTHTLTVSGDCNGKVTISAYDALGNESTKETDTAVKVDVSTPEITVVQSSGSVEPTQTIIVKATDAYSGIDETRFELGGKKESSPYVILSDDYYSIIKTEADLYQVTINAKKLHDNHYTKELSLACCDNVGRRNLIGLFVNMDETAPAAGDFSVMFFVKTAAEEFVDALVSNAFHLHIDSLYGDDSTLRMRVMVSPNGGSSIKSITAKNGSTAFTSVNDAGVQFDNNTGTYYVDFNVPLKSAEGVYDSITFTAEDAWGNPSGDVALKDTSGIHASENTPALETVLNITKDISPLVTITGCSGYKKTIGEGNAEYYAKDNSTFTLKAADGVGHIRSVKAYFGTPGEGGKPTATATLTGLGDDFTAADGVYTYNKTDAVTDEVSFTFTVPTDLASGAYVLYVEADNFARNCVPFSQVIYVDNDEPEITDVTHSTDWINTDDTLTFSAADMPDTNASEIATVTVNGTAATLQDGKYQFTMTTRQDYTIVATDNLGNSKTVVVEREDVMIDKAAPNISPFRYGDSGKASINDVDWANETTGIKVAFDVDDIVTDSSDLSVGETLSGVDAENVTVTGGDFSDLTYTYNSTTKQYTFSFIAKEFKQYTVTCQDLVVSDPKNSASATTATIKIDNTAPVITGVDLDVLRSLSFGVYSNNDVAATVSVSDSGPSSGFAKIEMTVNGGSPITPASGKVYVKGAANPDDAKAETDTGTVTIKKPTVSDEDSISFTVTDAVNHQTTYSFKELRTAEKITAGGSAVNKDALADGETFEVVTTDDAATFSASSATPGVSDPYHYQQGDKLWIAEKAADTGATVTNSFTVADTISHLFGATLTLNGTDYSAEVKSDEETKLAEGDSVRNDSGAVQYSMVKKSDDSRVDHKISGDTLSFTPNLAEHASLNKTADGSDGKNEVALTVENNSGNTASKTAVFYIDNTAPIITEVSYSGNGRADSEPEPIDENGNIIADLTTHDPDMEYGFYFRNRTVMTIKATDLKRPNGSAISGCGVRAIHVIKATLGGTIISDTALTALTPLGGGVSATFTVNANFKGRVYVYAVDNVSNRSSNYYPDGTIVENNNNHKNNSSATITVNTAPVAKDNKGNDLFDGNVSVTFDVTDAYMGLYELKYSVTSQWAAEDGYEGGVIAQSDVRIGQRATSVSGWQIVQKEANSNLITQARKTIILSSGKFNYNDLVIHVEALDRAGNHIYGTDKTISIDVTKPTIELTPVDATHNYYDPDSKDYYQETRTFNITVTERNFDPADFEKVAQITAREGSAPGIDGGTNWSTNYSDYSDSSTHHATISFSSDGDYTVELGYTDQAGNVGASVKSDDFVIDTIDPVLSVSFDNNSPLNGNYYGTARTATVTVEEHNFAEGDGYITFSPQYENGATSPVLATSGWSSSGDTHTTTLAFDQDGTYAFTITYKDKAARNANEVSEATFIIDLAVDDNAIVFTKNTANRAFGKEEVTPGVTFTDTNIDQNNTKATLTRISYDPKTGTQKGNPEGLKVNPGSTATTKFERYENFPDEEIYDGIYVYKATIMDLAGHTDSKTIIFSVNRYGATYMCEDDATKALLDSGYAKEVTDDLKIIEINVTEVKEYSVTSTCDTDTETLAETASGDQGFERRAIAGDPKASWYKYEYAIHKSNFGSEGDYTVTLSSKIEYTDKQLDLEMTNNTTRVEERSFPITFTVDKTPPEITISGVAADKAYSEAEKDVKIICVDKNINPETLEIVLNDEKLTSDQYTMSVLDGEIDIVLPINTNQTQETYNLEVSVGDLAQNVTNNDETKNFILSATWLTMFFHNTLAVVLTGVGLAAAVGVIILLILKKRKKESE